MRNLKKTLCLVLALVFVLGLCTVGAANVAFDDAEDITYTTAVKAMAGLGIIEGYPDGTFKPTQNVTRAEAAKIIAYVIVGPEVEKWPARQVFSDVPADHWAAKYITFCEYNKVINGDGNGKFRPNDPVKQDELAKMLLAACGYGAKDEFIGTGWDQNVAKIAFQTKVLKGIQSTDWDAPASREETALMAYNTMMNTHRVVLSDDTTSYEPEYINGQRGPTFAQNPWGLDYEKGVVIANKANTSGIKGTEIYLPDYGYSCIIETPDDENADLLGHEVTIMFREEKRGTTVVNVAYYIDDESTEVSGAAANTAEVVDYAYTVMNGEVTSGFGGYGKTNRYLDFAGTYVLNAEGELVAYKRSSYTIAPLSINAFTGIATADGHEVKAPEGAKSGDMMTVYQCGDIYTVKPCTSVEKKAIFQKQLGFDYITFNYYYSYNDGEILPSYATNLADADLTTINAYRINVDKSADYVPDLNVGYSYTLYFDAEGLCYAYSDEVLTSEAAIGNYSLFIAGFKMHDEYGVDQYYAQIVKSDGSVEKVAIDSKYARVETDSEGKDYVYIIDGDTSTDLVKGTAVSVGTKVLKAAPITKAMDDKYVAADPTYDYSTAKFVYYTGELGTLDTKTTLKPAKDSDITIIYKYVKVGTTWVTKVDTVFFGTKETAAAPAEQDSFIYIVNEDIYEIRLVNDVPVEFYNAYKDGVVMNDLRLQAGVSISDVQGFNKYVKQTDGSYKLTAVPAGDGTAIGTRSVELQNAVEAKKNGKCFILNNKLWLDDTAISIDLSGVTFVAVDEDAATLKLTSVSAIQSLLLSKDKTYTVTIDFVEYINGKVHTAGGSVIYVTAVTEAAE